MTDQNTDQPPAGDGKTGDGKTGGQGDDYGKPPTMGDLRAMVSETVESALKPFLDKLGAGSGGGGAGDGKAPPAAAGGQDAGDPPDLAGMVNAAIEKVLGDKKKESDEDAHRKQHEQLAAAAERPPVDRPRRAKWLGNIWDS